MEEMHNQMNSMKVRLEAMAENYFGPHFYDDAKEYVISHPFIAIALGMIGIFSVVPVAIFLGVFIVTAFFTLIVCICIEGSVLFISGLILIGIISFITIVTVCLTSAVALAYWSAQSVHRAMCMNTRSSRNAENNLSAAAHNLTARSDTRPQNPNVDGNSNPDSSSDRNETGDSENYEVIG